MKPTALSLSFIIVLALFDSRSEKAQNSYIVFFSAYIQKMETNQYSQTSVKFDAQTQYNNIKKANIKEDVDIALKHNDYRFIAIMDKGYSFPGVESKSTNGGEKNIKLIERFKFKILAVASVAYQPGEPALQKAAINYARIYNELLLSKLPK